MAFDIPSLSPFVQSGAGRAGTGFSVLVAKYNCGRDARRSPPPLTSKAERSPRKFPMCHSPAKASATTKEDKALGKNMRTRETTSSRSKNNNSTCTYHQDKALAKPPRPARASANTKKTKISSEHEGKENNPFSLNNKILYLYLLS